MQKTTRLLELGRKRQDARWPGYGHIAEYHGGAYECEFVSPYTKSAHNADASVMILLQDWSSHDWLSGPLHEEVQTLGRMPSLPTNRNLEELLRRHFALELKDVYATNLFPFVKRGSMTAPIPQRDLVRAAREFALPQIEIVQPHIAVCLGKSCFNAVRIAAGQPAMGTLEVAIRQLFFHRETQIWCQAHTGAIGRNIRNKGGIDRVTDDWSSMARAYRSRR